MKKKELWENRFFLAAFGVLSVAIVAAFTGLLLSLAFGNFPDGYLETAISTFIFLGGGPVCSSALLIITKASLNECYALGNGLFYGTIGVAFIINKLWALPNGALLILSFVIDALICYVVWLKKKR